MRCHTLLFLLAQSHFRNQTITLLEFWFEIVLRRYWIHMANLRPFESKFWLCPHKTLSVLNHLTFRLYRRHFAPACLSQYVVQPLLPRPHHPFVILFVRVRVCVWHITRSTGSCASHSSWGRSDSGVSGIDFGRYRHRAVSASGSVAVPSAS